MLYLSSTPDSHVIACDLGDVVPEKSRRSLDVLPGAPHVLRESDCISDHELNNLAKA